MLISGALNVSERGRKDTVTVDSQQVNRQPPAERVQVLNDGAGL